MIFTIYVKECLSGVTTVETVLSQVITYSLMVLMQVVVLTLFTLYVFNVSHAKLLYGINNARCSAWLRHLFSQLNYQWLDEKLFQ